MRHIYIVPTGVPPYTMETHIPPIDRSTPETWADGLIMQAHAVIEHGFGKTANAANYTCDDFLADMAGDVPWIDRIYRKVYKAALAHPDYAPTQAAFASKYGKDWGLAAPDPAASRERGRKHQLTAQLLPEVLAKLDAVAASEGRSRNGMLARMINAW